MCGIAGVITKKGDLVDKDELQRMENSMNHRGPDGFGKNNSRRVGFCMRRLSIIGLKTGQQPIYNESKDVEVIANGEIYNYKELVRELKRKGHKFKTKSDIEVATHLYEDMGIDFIKKLRGMFAVSLFDKKRGLVYLIRDRMGEKPLYWTKTKEGVAFASEMKTILQVNDVNKDLNYSSIDKYFHYYYVPEPETMFQSIRKLKPGSYLKIDLNDLSINETRYWNPSNISINNFKDPTELIKSTFEDSCRLSLTADVPVGISLSGGIDSGAILAFSAPFYKDKMKAFSIGYEGTPISDERKMAKKLAKKFKVEFIEQELKTSDVVKGFPDLIWRGDDPIADIAGHGIYSVNSLVRKNGVKVLLSGIGGDELFWGYPWTSQAISKTLDRKSTWQSKFFDNKHKMYFYDENHGFINAEKFISKMYHKDFKNRFDKDNSKKIMSDRGIDFKNKQMVAKKGMDLIRDVWLSSNCIALNDRLSMSTSVELRSPFLDYQLVEVALSSYRNVLSFNKSPKYYFKKAMKGILPDEVMNREKRGFTPPVTEWIKGINGRYIHLLLDGFLVQRKILNRNKVVKLIQNWEKQSSYRYSIYQLILMEIWGREFVFNQKPSELK